MNEQCKENKTGDRKSAPPYYNLHFFRLGFSFLNLIILFSEVWEKCSRRGKRNKCPNLAGALKPGFYEHILQQNKAALNQRFPVISARLLIDAFFKSPMLRFTFSIIHKSSMDSIVRLCKGFK